VKFDISVIKLYWHVTTSLESDNGMDTFSAGHEFLLASAVSLAQYLLEGIIYRTNAGLKHATN
jgi:hypothetical protein